MKLINSEELDCIVGGAAATLTTIIVIGTASLLTVAAYKLFQAFKGKLSLPGGFGIEFQTR